jgi:hypothetical protein
MSLGLLVPFSLHDFPFSAFFSVGKYDNTMTGEGVMHSVLFDVGMWTLLFWREKMGWAKKERKVYHNL